MGRTKSPVNTELSVEVPLSDDLNVTRNNWMPLHRIPKWPVCTPIMSGRLTPHSARFTT